VSKSASCGCGAVCLLRAMLLLRSPIKVLLAESELSFRNVPNDNVVGRARVPHACHDDLLLLVESKRQKT
jgi:hypothetical protein